MIESILETVNPFGCVDFQLPGFLGGNQVTTCYDREEGLSVEAHANESQRGQIVIGALAVIGVVYYASR